VEGSQRDVTSAIRRYLRLSCCRNRGDDTDLLLIGHVDQFRREIGKYVDKGEVARLERYVATN